MPVAAEIGSARRHDDEVPGAGLDVAVTTGAHVALDGLVGLDHPDLGVLPVVRSQPNSAHATSSTHTRSAAPTRT
jgi:hypothetical protein